MAEGAVPAPTATTGQRDAIPAPYRGLQVWNTTTNTLDTYTGTQWVAAGASPIFVYQQGAVGGGGGNVLPTFVLALAAANLAAPYAPTIVIDGSLGTPVIPTAAGTLTLPAGLTIRSRQYGTYTLTIQDGAHLVIGDSLYLVGITLDWQNTAAACVSLAGANVEVVLSDEAAILADALATQPFFALSAGAALSLRATDLSTIQGSAAAKVISAAAGTSANLLLSTGATLATLSLTGAGAIGVQVADTSVTYSQVQTGASAVTYPIGGGTVTTRVVAQNTSAESIADGGGAVTVTSWTQTRS